MAEMAVQFFPGSQITILSAAVSDYRPMEVAEEKIKKIKKSFSILLERNPDIASMLGKQKKDSQLIIGFALETNNEVINAKEKLKKKNFDFIVLNTLKNPGAGFHYDTNQVSFIFPQKKKKDFELKSKKLVARDIADEIRDLIKSQKE